MSLNLAAAAPPIFFKTNYLKDSVDHVTVTSMSALSNRIVDMDPYATWNSSGSTDSTNPQTIDIPIYVGTAQTLRTDIALIALLNINFKDFVVYLSSDNGATFTDTYTVTSNSLSNYIIDASAATKSANFIRVYVTTTFASTPNVEKILGAVVVTGLIYQMTTYPAHPISRDTRESVRVLQMADGSQDITYVKRSAASYEFYVSTFNFQRVSTTELDALRSLRRLYPAFIYYPEPGDRTGEIYWCMFAPGSFKAQLAHTVKSFGYNLAYTVEEISG